jgi:hypothetical protein
MLTKLYRKLRPSVNSPYTLGPVADICAVQLVYPSKLRAFFDNCIGILKRERGGEVGDYLEFGVFNGTSLSSMYRATKEAGLASTRFFGFDAFEGLPPGSEKGDAGVFKPGFYTCSYPQLEECLRKRQLDPQDFVFIKGWYNETLTSELKQKYHFAPGLIFIDCDTYDSSKVVLDFVAPLITQPTIISFDDWRLYDLDVKGEGEYRAFNEFIEANPRFKVKEIATYKRNARTFLVTVQ